MSTTTIDANTALTQAKQYTDDQVAKLRAELQLPGGTTTPAKLPLVGAAVDWNAPGLLANWDALCASLGATPQVYRTYGGGSIPTSFSTVKAAAPKGVRQFLGVKCEIATLADPNLNGALRAAIHSFASSCPPDLFLSWQGEPDNRHKGIDPTAFAAGWKVFYDVAKDANPHIAVGPVFMSYTAWSTARTPGKNAWLTAVDPTKADFVGIDIYPENGGTTEANAAPTVKLARDHFGSDIALHASEYGYPRETTNRAALMKAGWDYFKREHFVSVLYYDVNMANGNFALTGDGSMATLSAMLREALAAAQ